MAFIETGKAKGNRLALCVVYQSWIDKSKEMSNLNRIFLPDTKGENWARSQGWRVPSAYLASLKHKEFCEVAQVGTEEWRKNCGEGLI